MNPAESTNPWLLVRYDSERHIQMLAVLERYGIGQKDANNRGVWVTQGQIRKLVKQIRSEGHEYTTGADPHCHVWCEDFEQLWTGERYARR